MKTRKITPQELRAIIRGHIRSLREEKNKSTPFGSGFEIADLDKDQKKIIGHTWLTHVRRKGSALNEIGEVIWHSLTESGQIDVYDVYWPDQEYHETNIPAGLLEDVTSQKHEHVTHDVDDPDR